MVLFKIYVFSILFFNIKILYFFFFYKIFLFYISDYEFSKLI